MEHFDLGSTHRIRCRRLVNVARQGRSQEFYPEGDKTVSGSEDPQRGPGVKPRWGSGGV